MHGGTEDHVGTPATRLRIDDNTVTFTAGTGDTTVPAVTLAVGPAAVARAHFRHAPPTAYELETAIAAVEDEIMRQRGHVPGASTLTVDGDDTRVLATLTDAGSTPVPLDAVERQFNAMVAATLRCAPTGVDPPYRNDTIATALVIREIMHHLGFGWLVLWAPGH